MLSYTNFVNIIKDAQAMYAALQKWSASSNKPVSLVSTS